MNFIEQKGKAKALSTLNIRKGPTTKDLIVNTLQKGQIFEYIGWVEDGELFKNNFKWYKTSDGNYFWSRLVEEINELILVKKFIYNPLDKIEITQHFGEDPAYYARYKLKGHHGLDFRTIFKDSPNGKRKVFAVMNGSVMEARFTSANGNFIRLQHNGTEQTVYLHLDSIEVAANQKISAGDVVGISDNSGASKGSHLHFGYRPNNFDVNNGYMGYIDPESYLV
jgi:murein DD-endopeptidase MepM/ murein hydrolase activator NlpD